MKKHSKKKIKKRHKKSLRNKVAVADIKSKVVVSPAEAQSDLELDDQEVAPVLEGYDEHSLARAKTHWFFGEWEQLVALDMGSLRTHPDRDRFALLIASANQQLGEHDKARKFTRMAIDWGCPYPVVAQVLIAGVHNTLGRAAAIKQDESRITHHFEASVAAIGTSDATLVSHARSVREMAKMGLLPQAATLVDKQIQLSNELKGELRQQATDYKVLAKEIELLRHELSLTQQKRAGVQDESGVEPFVSNNTAYSSEAYAFYQGISKASIKENATPFILLDSKSLPRSGLHYMNKIFSEVLKGDFSFCEWYYEPGCCKKMPCALTAYANQCKKTQTSRLRLIKSHDFDLTDPAYPAVYSARRVILIREPLYLLTSYFALEQLLQYKTVLKNNGINMEKIWLHHEPEVVSMAYRLMDESFIPPDSDVLVKWLAEKYKYITGFFDKWVLPAMNQPQSFVQVVRYEEINSFVSATLKELRDYLPHESQQRIDAFSRDIDGNFHARKDPYSVPSAKLSAYLLENSRLFTDTVEELIKADRSGLMRLGC